MAVPNPNSANDNIVKIFVKSPLTPKYSSFKVLINTVLTIKIINLLMI